MSAAPDAVTKVTKVVVFTKAFCPYCSLLKNELRKRGVQFESVDLTDDTTRQAFYDNAGVTTVPQLYVVTGSESADALDGVRLGGWTEVSNDWNTLHNLVGSA